MSDFTYQQLTGDLVKILHRTLLLNWRSTPTTALPDTTTPDIIALFEKSLEGIWKKEPEP